MNIMISVLTRGYKSTRSSYLQVSIYKINFLPAVGFIYGYVCTNFFDILTYKRTKLFYF